jgi:hypothetical protein
MRDVQNAPRHPLPTHTTMAPFNSSTTRNAKRRARTSSHTERPVLSISPRAFEPFASEHAFDHIFLGSSGGTALTGDRDHAGRPPPSPRSPVRQNWKTTLRTHPLIASIVRCSPLFSAGHSFDSCAEQKSRRIMQRPSQKLSA